MQSCHICSCLWPLSQSTYRINSAQESPLQASPPPQFPGTTHLLLLSYHLKNVTYGNHTVCNFGVWLLSCSRISQKSFQVPSGAPSFSKSNRTPQFNSLEHLGRSHLGAHANTSGVNTEAEVFVGTWAFISLGHWKCTRVLWLRAGVSIPSVL